MSYQHNVMVHQVSARLLEDIRSSKATWLNSQLSPKATLWQGVADWPRPDIAFQDTSNNASLAFEFKPPNQPKGVYVTGLGQALTYLRDFKFAGLILPEFADDGFRIAHYISNVLSGILAKMPITLLSYQDDPSSHNVLRKLQSRKDGPTAIPKGVGREFFWGYWRDLSNHDLLTLLTLLDTIRPPGTFEEAFDRFWKKFAATGKAQTWEGNARKKKSLSAPGQSGEQLNVQLSLRHAELLDSQGRITADGYELLHIGKVYGASSLAFLQRLGRHVLISGRHLELIFWIDEHQRKIPRNRKAKAPQFYRQVDLRLAEAGIISAPPTSASKPHFIRDEPKLWNKLGFLVPATRTQYFHPGQGLVFDWRKIISVLEGG